MQILDSQTINPSQPHQSVQNGKPTQKPPERVGEDWPPLLTKKWLAIHFGCFNGREILRRRFRSHVLTEDVLQKAGISTERAYSKSTKTFTATESIMLTQILRGFCLIFFLILSGSSLSAQNPQSVKYSGDKFINDTIPGIAMLSDSVIRMVPDGPVGFRYEKVLSTIVVDAYMVKQYRWLVRAIDGGTEPFDLTQSFHLITGGQIDPKRILMFKTSEK